MKHKPGEPYDRRQLKDAVKAVADPGEEPGGGGGAGLPTLLFRPNRGPKGRQKNFFGDRPTLGSLSNYDDDHNDDFKTTIGLMIKTTALHVRHAF